MILRTFTISLAPEHPHQFSIEQLRLFLRNKLEEYSALPGNDRSGFLHRYPVLQCKEIRGGLLVIGISQGADCLHRITRNQVLAGTGDIACRITARDPEIRDELCGISAEPLLYEFLTPYLALNQQHAKKFYDLQGSRQRDSFMKKLLTDHLNMLTKSLGCAVPAPVSCEPKVRFRRDRIEGENVMVFLGKFRTNLLIPDHLGVGRSVSQGFGTIKRITEPSDTIPEGS